MIYKNNLTGELEQKQYVTPYDRGTSTSSHRMSHISVLMEPSQHMNTCISVHYNPLSPCAKQSLGPLKHVREDRVAQVPCDSHLFDLESDVTDKRNTHHHRPQTPQLDFPKEIIQEILSFITIRLSGHIIPDKYDYSQPNCKLNPTKAERFQHQFMRLMYGKLRLGKATIDEHEMSWSFSEPFLLFKHLDLTHFFKQYQPMVCLTGLESVLNCGTICFDGQLSPLLISCSNVTRVTKWVLNQESAKQLYRMNVSQNNRERKWEKLNFSCTGDAAAFRRAMDHFLESTTNVPLIEKNESLKSNETIHRDQDRNCLSDLKSFQSTSCNIGSVLKVLQFGKMPSLRKLTLSLALDDQLLSNVCIILNTTHRTLESLSLLSDAKFYDKTILNCDTSVLDSLVPKTNLKSLRLFNFAAANIPLKKVFFERSPHMRKFNVAEFHNSPNYTNYVLELVTIIKEFPNIAKWLLRGEVANEFLIRKLSSHNNVKSLSVRTHISGLANHSMLSTILKSDMHLKELNFAALTYHYSELDWTSYQVNCQIDSLTLFPNIDVHRIDLISQVCHRLSLKSFEIVDYYDESTHAHFTPSMNLKLRTMIQKLIQLPSLESLSYSLITPTVDWFSDLSFSTSMRELKLNGKFKNMAQSNQIMELFNSCSSLQQVTFIKMSQKYLNVWRKNARFDVIVLSLKQ